MIPMRSTVSATLLALLLILSTATSGCSRIPHQMSTAELTIKGSSSTVDSLGIAAGYLQVSGGTPGISCGTIMRRGDMHEFAYVILMRFDDEEGVNPFVIDHASSSSHGDHQMNAASEIAVGGVTLSTEHSATLSEDGRTISSERLVLQGVEFDPSKGRVFLLRSSAADGKLVQVDMELPDAFAPEDEWAPFLRSLASELPATNVEIAAFLED